LEGAIAAEGMVGLKLNVEEKNLKKVLSLLTSLEKSDDFEHLAKSDWRGG
jgi:hypothetical protein